MGRIGGWWSSWSSIHDERGTHIFWRGKSPMHGYETLKKHETPLEKKWCPILQDKPKSGVCQYWKEEMMLARFWENVCFFFETVKPDGGESPCWLTGGMSVARDYHTEYNSSCFESRKCFWMCLICFDYIKYNFPNFPTLKLKRIWAVNKTTSVDWLL